MRKMRIILILTAAGVCIPLAALALCADRPFVPPSDALWKAIVTVESRGDARAFNPHDGATGMAQIRSVCLTDVNRIARLRGQPVHFTSADRFNPPSARRLWDLYLDFYGREYLKATGRTPTDEVYARIWNGGPAGWRKPSTLAYWGRVRDVLGSEGRAPPAAGTL